MLTSIRQPRIEWTANAVLARSSASREEYLKRNRSVHTQQTRQKAMAKLRSVKRMCQQDHSRRTLALAHITRLATMMVSTPPKYRTESRRRRVRIGDRRPEWRHMRTVLPTASTHSVTSRTVIGTQYAQRYAAGLCGIQPVKMEGSVKTDITCGVSSPSTW